MADLILPGQILTGAGQLERSAQVAAAWGKRCLLCTGSHPERADRLRRALVAAGLVLHEVALGGEPTFGAIEALVPALRRFGPQLVVAFGGGSVIDGAKVLAMMATNQGTLWDYAEIVGAGQPIPQPALPLMAIPTTAGTGAETTRNAVLKSTDHQVKVSIRHTSLLPRVVVLDPASLEGLTPTVAAHSGLDALCQLIEALVSIKANVWTQAWCRAGIPLAWSALPRLVRHPSDPEAGLDMLTAACWSGLALTNAGLGAAHGFAGVVGGLTNLPHGQICGQLLAPVCRANWQALRARGASVAAYATLVSLITGQAESHITEGDFHATFDHIESLVQQLAVGPLHGTEALDETLVLRGAQAASSMKGNPVVLTEAELVDLWRSVHR